jgi:hypothetical protein
MLIVLRKSIAYLTKSANESQYQIKQGSVTVMVLLSVLCARIGETKWAIASTSTTREAAASAEQRKSRGSGDARLQGSAIDSRLCSLLFSLLQLRMTPVQRER